MLSESSRMSSAAEARFRVQAPNSKPRAIVVIAVDTTSDRVVRHLAEGVWSNARFLTAAHVDGTAPPPPTGGSLMDLTGGSADLVNEVNRADLVVMVASPGGHANAAGLIGEACSHKRVMTTALVVSAATASDEEVARTLAQLRPWSLMVVIANADDYIEDMLLALRAS
jgi:hypothetical protein